MGMCIARVRSMMLRMGVRKGAVKIMKSMISDWEDDEDNVSDVSDAGDSTV
jgi:hypothetical protein